MTATMIRKTPVTDQTRAILFAILLSYSLAVSFALGEVVSVAQRINLLGNGGFESTLEGKPPGWKKLWTRDIGAGRAAQDNQVSHGGSSSFRIEHKGIKDWSAQRVDRLEVRPGDLLLLEGWIRLLGEGSATLGVVTYDADGEVCEWAYGGRTAQESREWLRLRSRFVIPEGVAFVLPRLIGAGPATVWFDDCSLVNEGNVETWRQKGAPETLTVANAAISVTFHTGNAALSVTDKRTGQVWRQRAISREAIVRQADRRSDRSIAWTWLHAASGIELRSTLILDSDLPEFSLTLSAEGSLEAPIRFPHPFVTDAGTRLIVPMNEGISFPVDDPAVDPMRLVAYGGHGICMAFWGVTDDGGRGHMAILETPDDGAIRIQRNDGLLSIAPEWDSQRGKFGYERRLRYVFFSEGGHVALCKRYRAYAREKGTLKTLKEKRRAIPAVDLLVGAVNVWCWEGDALEALQKIRDAGIERVLWSRRAASETVAAMNAMPGVLTSRYDIYQDLMDPKIVQEQLRRGHSDWTQKGWPDDIMRRADGDWVKGWKVRGKDGGMYPCGVLCDLRAPAYARRRVAKELKTRPYRSRFIDTTTASPWRECYDEAHPMTRGESRRAKMDLLRVMSDEMGLVTGCETGHEAAVPYVHYFEGMLSLGPYRVPDAGRNMIQPVVEPPERVVKFQMGQRYRLPLWELVYHDCVVAQWYWGDYNNKLPALWDKRDLFNILYGTPPMFMFNDRIWEERQERFVQSYQNVCPVVRRVGYAEMLDHHFLTINRDVQQTRFSNGVVITVNFGSKAFTLTNGKVVQPLGFNVD